MQLLCCGNFSKNGIEIRKNFVGIIFTHKFIVICIHELQRIVQAYYKIEYEEKKARAIKWTKKEMHIHTYTMAKNRQQTCHRINMPRH